MWYALSKLHKTENISTGIIFRKINDKIEVLLVKRGTKPHIGDWCIPGGHIEKNEDPLDAVLREIKEETNINLNKNKLFLVDHISSDKSNNYIYTIIQTKYNIEKPGSDAADAKWYDISDLPDLIWNNNLYIDKALNYLRKNL